MGFRLNITLFFAHVKKLLYLCALQSTTGSPTDANKVHPVGKASVVPLHAKRVQNDKT